MLKKKNATTVHIIVYLIMKNLKMFSLLGKTYINVLWWIIKSWYLTKKNIEFF